MWAAIPGFPGYEASDAGTVRSSRCVLRPFRDGSGHLQIGLYRDGRKVQIGLHQAVLLAFAGACPQGQEVRHLNDDPTDNRMANLVYGTRSENQQDRRRNGIQHNVIKTHCPSGHPYDAENTYLRADRPGSRDCRKCRNSRSARKAA